MIATWVSFVDKHSNKNIGFMLFEGHIEIASIEIQEEDFARMLEESPEEAAEIQRCAKGVLLQPGDWGGPLVKTNGQSVGKPSPIQP